MRANEIPWPIPANTGPGWSEWWQEIYSRRIRADREGRPGPVVHWGIWVDSEEPTTGVFSNHSLEWIHEEEGEDPDWIELTELAETDPEQFRIEYGLDPDEEINVDCWDYQQSTTYIGMVRGAGGEWDVDPEAEYSAIVTWDGMGITQVLRSQWVLRGALCSPCCPGQVDADSDGEFLCYSVPPSLIGFDEDEDARRLKERISPLPGTPAWDSVVAEYDRGGEVGNE